MAIVERIHWILATTDGLDLFTDHHNLIFLFGPLTVYSDHSQTSLRKVLRWAVHLSAYNCTGVHIKGVDKVWADLLGRCSAPAVIRRLVNIPIFLPPPHLISNGLLGLISSLNRKHFKSIVRRIEFKKMEYGRIRQVLFGFPTIQSTFNLVCVLFQTPVQVAIVGRHRPSLPCDNILSGHFYLQMLGPTTPLASIVFLQWE